MPDLTVSTPIDNFMQSTTADGAAAVINLANCWQFKYVYAAAVSGDGEFSSDNADLSLAVLFNFAYNGPGGVGNILANCLTAGGLTVDAAAGIIIASLTDPTKVAVINVSGFVFGGDIAAACQVLNPTFTLNLGETYGFSIVSIRPIP